MLIEESPDIYDIISNLKVTRSKARNLLYDVNMRNSSQDSLDDDLKALLSKPIFYKENNKIAIEISNPLLLDHFKWKIKKLGYITDGSFSPELVKLSLDAYLAVFRSMIPDDSHDKILKALEEALEKAGVKTDKNSNKFKDFLETAIKTVLNKAGESIIDNTYEYLNPLITSNIYNIIQKYSDIFK